MTSTRSGLRLTVIGGGPGGYPAAFLAAELGMDVTLVDLEPRPGGVCLYRGCIPSKALLHAASVITATQEAGSYGLKFNPPEIDLAALRQWKDGVVGKLAQGLGAICRQRKVKLVQGRARFLNARTVSVARAGEPDQIFEFDSAIIATGSRPAAVPGLDLISPRVMDSTSALELESVPGTLLVVGGGYIGLELGTVYAALGSKVTVVEMTSGLLPGVDRDLVQPLARRLAGQFDTIMLDTKVVEMKAEADGIAVKLAGAMKERPDRTFEKVLVAVGRRPNVEDLGLATTRVELNERGCVRTDAQRRTAEPNIFAIGDVAGEPMLAHKATHEARVAVEAIAGRPSAFEPAAIPAVVFTDPEIAWCGLTEAGALSEGASVNIAKFPWTASGRAATLGRGDGLTKLVLERGTNRVLGVGITGAGAGELIAEGVLAVEMGARADDLKLTIHPHPTLSETLMEAAEVFFGLSPHYVSPKQR